MEIGANIAATRDSPVNQEETQALFLRFATPLVFFVQLGGGKKALESVARTLWTALLGGPAVEKQVWQELESSDIDRRLIDSIRACYYDEMRPLVTEAELESLRQRYGIEVRD